jgi:hypothetical protein
MGASPVRATPDTKTAPRQPSDEVGVGVAVKHSPIPPPRSAKTHQTTGRGPGRRLLGRGDERAEAHRSELFNNEPKLPTGPRCASLSGLTIERMPWIWPSTISSAHTLIRRP